MYIQRENKVIMLVDLLGSFRPDVLPEAREAVAGVAVHLVQAGALVQAGQRQAVVDVDLALGPGESWSLPACLYSCQLAQVRST
jgi:hypothetical protein